MVARAARASALSVCSQISIHLLRVHQEQGNLRGSIEIEDDLRLKACSRAGFLPDKEDPMLTTELNSCILILVVFHSFGWAAGLGFCSLKRNQFSLQAVATPAQSTEERQVARREFKV
jgi:hypothetical protein